MVLEFKMQEVNNDLVKATILANESEEIAKDIYYEPNVVGESAIAHTLKGSFGEGKVIIKTLLDMLELFENKEIVIDSTCTEREYYIGNFTIVKSEKSAYIQFLVSEWNEEGEE